MRVTIAGVQIGSSTSTIVGSLFLADLPGRAEVEGFVMNRLQAAVVNEAPALVAAGVIDPAGLEAVMKHSLGLRWALMGPFETMDLNAPSGFLDYATRYHRYYEAMGRQLSVADPWPAATLQAIETVRRATVPADALAERIAWRDRGFVKAPYLIQGIFGISGSLDGCADGGRVGLCRV